MKKTILVLSLLLMAYLGYAQEPKRLPPPDTSFYNALSTIAKDAIKIISESDTPAKKADNIRQQLQAISQACEAYKAQLIADEKKKVIKKP